MEANTKLKKTNNILFISVFIGVLISILLLHKFAVQTPRAYSALYFEDYSDLPMSIKKTNNLESKSSMNYLEINKTYKIVFTIASYEEDRMQYTYKIISPFLNKCDGILIDPGSRRTIALNMTPKRADWKWQKRIRKDNFNYKFNDTTEYKEKFNNNIIKLLNIDSNIIDIRSLINKLPDSNEISNDIKEFIYNYEVLDIKKKNVISVIVKLSKNNGNILMSGTYENNLSLLELQKFTVLVESTKNTYEIYFNFSVR